MPLTNTPHTVNRILAAATLALLVYAGFIFVSSAFALFGPGPARTEQFIAIEPGQGRWQIARQLAATGVIRDAAGFTALSVLGNRTLQAGEYRFTPAQSTADVLRQIQSGRVHVYALTIPEGWTSAQIRAALESDKTLSGDTPADIAQGTLLPETYHFRRGTTRAELAGRMADDHRAFLSKEWETRSPGLPVTTPEQAVILASIVEKETGVTAERARVAGVFINRLRIGMRLQSDPTVAFALTMGRADLGRALTTRDLNDTDSPYNTYRYAGLPPGAIAHPGKESIKAVLHPETHDFIYFVADGTGGHAFARTLAEHNANVARWRQINKKP